MEEYNENIVEKNQYENEPEKQTEQIEEQIKAPKKELERIIVKGYMRPDKSSYHIVIPKEVRELFNLKGGEYFLIKAKPRKNEIKLKIAKFVEEP